MHKGDLVGPKIYTNKLKRSQILVFRSQNFFTKNLKHHDKAQALLLVRLVCFYLISSVLKFA